LNENQQIKEDVFGHKDEMHITNKSSCFTGSYSFDDKLIALGTEDGML